MPSVGGQRQCFNLMLETEDRSTQCLMSVQDILLANFMMWIMLNENYCLIIACLCQFVKPGSISTSD